MNYKQLQANRKARRLFLLRYLCPVAGLVLLLLALQSPCLQYSTASTGENQAISTAQLLQNSWNEVREYLFGDSEQLSITLTFSRVVLVTLSVCTFCFLIGSAAMIWLAVGAVRYLLKPEDRGTARIVWITLFPNRIVACLYFAFLLPLLAFPRILIPIYANMLGSAVTLKFSAFEPLWLGLLLFVGIVILSACLVKRERMADLDPFESSRNREDPEEAEDESERLRTPSEEDEQTRKLREEQLLKIRQLLNKDDKDSEET